MPGTFINPRTCHILSQQFMGLERPDTQNSLSPALGFNCSCQLPYQISFQCVGGASPKTFRVFTGILAEFPKSIRLPPDMVLACSFFDLFDDFEFAPGRKKRKAFNP